MNVEEQDDKNYKDDKEEDAIADSNATIVPQQEQAELEEAQRDVEQFRNLLQRVQADSVNYKRRVEEERDELQKRANANLLLRLLPILDDLERALNRKPLEDEIGPWVTGIEMVHHNLSGVLEIFGATQIEAIGKPFDPSQHESISYEINSDYPEETVTSIIREGYKIHGFILRPAQVTVSKKDVQNEEVIEERKINSDPEEEK